MRMQWIVDHWFEITTTILLTIIAINTLDGKWNNSTIVEQLNDLIHSFSCVLGETLYSVAARLQ